ncbi:UNVERIFIED_ORG: hypothetical protein J2X79_004684 [Arthrobacter globiformis]|nr:hypothetical protein [Arthrobacter globiformis]
MMVVMPATLRDSRGNCVAPERYLACSQRSTAPRR